MTYNEVITILIDTFKNVNFEPDNHIYTVEGKIKSSVTAACKNYYEPFDKVYMAKMVARSRQDVSYTDVIDEWNQISNQAVTKGVNLHQFACDYPDRQAVSDEEKAVVKWFEAMDPCWKVVLQEKPIYSSQLDLCGTPDTLIWKQDTLDLIIQDWKTNKDIYKNYKSKKLFAPFDDMLDCPLNRYFIQLNYYKKIIEHRTPFHVSDMIITWIPGSDYIDIPCPDLTQKL